MSLEASIITLSEAITKLTAALEKQNADATSPTSTTTQKAAKPTKKLEPVPGLAVEDTTNPSAAEPEPEPETKEEAISEPEAVTYVALKVVFLKFCARFGEAEALKLLTEFKATGLSKIKESDFAAAYKYIQSRLQEE